MNDCCDYTDDGPQGGKIEKILLDVWDYDRLVRIRVSPYFEREKTFRKVKRVQMVRLTFEVNFNLDYIDLLSLHWYGNYASGMIL